MQLESCDSAPADWQRLSVSAICRRFTSGGTPSRKVPDYFTGTIPWVKTQELTDCLLEDSAEHISEEAVSASSAKLLPVNTVLMAMYGATVGQLGVLAKPMTCNQACAAMVVDSDKVDYRFLYYQLMAAREQIKSLSTGAAQQNLSGAQIKQFVLPFPSVAEQTAVADTLWQIDRRIDLLRQTNATLESIAQALFKSWFIDFDPVRAKAEGREPEGMDAATAALFPAEFEESALGLIPKGWQIASVAALASLRGGKQLDRGEFHDAAPNPIFGGAGEMGRTAQSNAEGFVLTVGRVGAYCGQFFWHEGAAWVNNNASHVLPHDSKDSYWLHQALLNSDMDKIKKGAAQPFVSNGDIANLPIILPDAAARLAFRAIAEPLYKRQVVLANTQQALENLRDTLLPRLISGKLRLPGAEAAIKDVT